MYAVIFTAKIKSLQQEDFSAYSEMAGRLREKAKQEYNCIDFICLTENNREIAISYWHSPQDIAQWKQDDLHRQAQQLGKSEWYESYRVEIVEVCRRYEK